VDVQARHAAAKHEDDPQTQHHVGHPAAGHACWQIIK
jgi:hypothetical protein